MEYLDLGRLEKGSLLFDTKRKSFQQRWMSVKKRQQKDNPDNSSVDYAIFIERDSLISLHCTQGDSVTVENYRVLGPFTKFYNKWYVCVDQSKFPLIKDCTKVRFLVRMMCGRGGVVKRLSWKRTGTLGHIVFIICSMKNIVDVMGSW